MGLEIIATAIAGSGVYQAERAREASKQQRRAADLQKESNAQSAAMQEFERRQAIKQQMRQERVRQAQVMSAAEASGVSGSSVEATTIGAGQTLAAVGQAFATGSTITNRNISGLNQQAADARSSAAFDLTQAGYGEAVKSTAVSAFSAFNAGG